MNFLAHIHLSGKNEPIIIGNFIGDFVKGKEIDNYDERIRNGIVLHREIDHFTDNHEVVLESKKRLRPRYRHYAPVIIDVYYDHFLATHWSKYSSEDLKRFTEHFYALTANYKDQIPDRARYILRYMKRDNWLYNYQFLDGIRRALTGMSQRTKYDSKMEHAVEELRENYESFEQEFFEFFPALQSHCDAFIKSLP